MIKIHDWKFENIGELLSIDLAPLFIRDVQRRLWEEADERELDYPNLDCLSFIADSNPHWQIKIY